MLKLEGKIALVTGGNSGIGLATAQQFIAEGAYVFITGRRQAELDAAVQHLGENSRGVQGDVAVAADLDRLFETIRQEKGHLDVVFANAAVGQFTPLGQIDEAQFDRQFGSNVKGLLFTVQKALPLMPDGAAIVLNGSVAGSVGMAGGSVYGATKAAVRSFVRSWSVDLKERKIRVNVVSPGQVDTPSMREITGYDGGDEHRAALSAGNLLGRIGQSEEIAKAVVFLASDDSSYVTGIELFVDGGMAHV